MEFDDEGTKRIIQTFSKGVVDSIKLGDMDLAAERLQDLIELLVQKYDEEHQE